MDNLLSKLEKELEELEHREFMLQMCDHWDSSDYRLSWELNDKIKAKKEEIEKCKSNLK